MTISDDEPTPALDEFLAEYERAGKLIAAALAAGEAPTEPSTCKHGQTKAHRFRSLVTYPRGEFDCPGPVPQGGTQ